MRFVVVVVVACLLAAGCSSGSRESTSPSSSETEPEASQSTAAAASDSCDRLSADEVRTLAGTPAGEPTAVLVGSLPACKWATENGFVQVGSLSAQDWAQGLPELLRTFEEAGLAREPGDRRTLQELSEILEAERDLTSTEACSAFSKMLEVQGQPAGTTLAVNLWPSKEDPQAMAGQMCSAGWYTTVTLAENAGLAEPLPHQRLVTALRLAHRRSLG